MESKNILQYYIEAFTKNFANFEGRARRLELWGFVLINVIVSYVLNFLGSYAAIFGIISFLYGIAALIPSLAVWVRRMHDVGKSGWFILIPIYNIILGFTEGDYGVNEYGPDPKNPDMGDELDDLGAEEDFEE